MPRAPKNCPVPGCPKAVVELGRCEVHQRVRMIAPWTREPGHERDHQAATGHAHVVARKRILIRDAHRCYKCGLYADEVDHITPVFEGGPTNDTNMAAICRQCHGHKSAMEGVRAKREKRAS